MYGVDTFKTTYQPQRIYLISKPLKKVQDILLFDQSDESIHEILFEEF